MMMEIEKPKITCEETDNGCFARFVVEPLDRGFGLTLGNALRRVLLSALPGAAAVGIKINGVQHEFSTIKGVVGGSDSLWYEFLPADSESESVTWSSSDNNVATIDANGTVSFLKEGTATITATSENGLTATCTITVESLPKATAITITYEGSLTGYVGESVSLKSNPMNL